MSQEPSIHQLTDGDLAVRVSSRGGAILSLSMAGTPLLVPAGGPMGTMASFPLVPFGNRIEFNRFDLDGLTYNFAPNTSDPLHLHGDGWLSDWDVETADQTTARLRLRHNATDTSPYDYTARQTVSLSGNRLTLSMSVTNEASETMPFGLGQHPFFLRTPQLRITASFGQFWPERAGHLPGQRSSMTPADLDFRNAAGLPDRFINNAFGNWQGTALIEWPELGMTARIDTSPRLDVFMLYAPTDPAEFFCLEPMTHLPNGHHMDGLGGLTLLGKAETLHSSMTLEFRRQDNG